MQLDDRKWTILKAIIKTYLETGEPVGSRTISKYADLNLSSATIRNEMSDLEEMGLILQPHTSAGRIPSDAGYRLYVDHMMTEKDREVTEMKEMMIQRQDKMELVLKQLARVLANNTNYAAMISGPQYHQTKLKFIQLSIVNESQILAVIVTQGNLSLIHICRDGRLSDCQLKECKGYARRRYGDLRDTTVRSAASRLQESKSNGLLRYVSGRRGEISGSAGRTGKAAVKRCLFAV